MKYIKKKTVASRPHVICIRLSSDEHLEVIRKSEECGLNKSDYVRRIITGYQPKKRMTDEEREAFLALSGARKDLIYIYNVLRGVPDEAKRRYFKDADFMRTWISNVTLLIQQWKGILDRLVSN